MKILKEKKLRTPFSFILLVWKYNNLINHLSKDPQKNDWHFLFNFNNPQKLIKYSNWYDTEKNFWRIVSANKKTPLKLTLNTWIFHIMYLSQRKEEPATSFDWHFFDKLDDWKIYGNSIGKKNEKVYFPWQLDLNFIVFLLCVR